VRDAKAAVHVAAESVAGSVVAALPQSVSPMIALPLMRAAARRYPDVVLHLNEELTGNMADQLLRGRVDVAVFSPAMPAEDIRFVPLVEEDFVFLESPQSPHALPPIIVYTGRVLSPAEEVRLGRYSSSIIIKGARSPERLLDEVTLFLHKVVSDLPESQQGMIRSAQHRDTALEGRRVLVVEDDVRNIYALMNVLEPHGCKVTIARNGQEAIDVLTAAVGGPSPIELVLMDIMMPVKDGLTATREIRQDGRFGKLPIIALTAKAMPDDQQQCIQAGANDYVAKPLDVDKLVSLIRVWLMA